MCTYVYLIECAIASDRIFALSAIAVIGVLVLALGMFVLDCGCCEKEYSC